MAGPTALSTPEGVERIDVESAEEMWRAMQPLWREQDAPAPRPHLQPRRQRLPEGAAFESRQPRRAARPGRRFAGDGTAQEALDGLVKDWVEVFEDEGKL